MLRPRSKCKQRSNLKHSVGVCYRVPSPNETAREERNGELIGSPRVEIGTARRYPMFQRFLWVRLLARQDCRPKDDSGGIRVGGTSEVVMGKCRQVIGCHAIYDSVSVNWRAAPFPLLQFVYPVIHRKLPKTALLSVSWLVAARFLCLRTCPARLSLLDVNRKIVILVGSSQRVGLPNSMNKSLPSPPRCRLCG